MKKFKEFFKENVGVFQTSGLSSEHIPHDIDDPQVVSAVNAVLGHTATSEFLNPKAAIAQMEAKLSLLGLELDHSAVEFDGLSEEGSFDIPMKRYGDIMGKSVDTPIDEIEHEERAYNLSIRFEKLDTGTYKVYGSLD